MSGADPLVTYIRDRIEQWLEEDPTRTASQLAAAAKVTSTTISDIRAGKGGVGMKTLRGLAAAWGTTAADLERLAQPKLRDASPERVVEYEPQGDTAAATMRGYEDAERVARAENPHVPEEAWQGARRVRGFALPDVATPSDVLELAETWQRLDRRRRARQAAAQGETKSR